MNARPHLGFGMDKAAGDAQALAKHLRDHEDIDAALKAYNAERQPIGNQVPTCRIAQLGSLGPCVTSIVGPRRCATIREMKEASWRQMDEFG
jgi:hypothetical protein